MPGQSSPALRLPMSVPSLTGDGGWVAVFTTRPRARAARSCAPRPSGSRPARRRCAPPDGRGWPPPARSRRTAPATARTASGAPMRRAILGVARRRAGRMRERLPHALLESGAADVQREVQPERGVSTKPTTRATLLEARIAAEQAWPWGKRSCRSRTSASGSSPRGSRTRPARSRPPGSRRANTRRPRSVSSVSAPPAESAWASCPASCGRRRRSGRRTRSPRRRSLRSRCLLRGNRVPHPLRALRRRIGLGRQAGDGLEHPVQVEPAHRAPPRPVVEARHASAVSMRRHTSATTAACCTASDGSSRLAAQAGAEAGAQRIGRVCRGKPTFSGRGAREPHSSAGSTRRSCGPSSRRSRRRVGPDPPRPPTDRQRWKMVILAAPCSWSLEFMIVLLLGLGAPQGVCLHRSWRSPPAQALRLLLSNSRRRIWSGAGPPSQPVPRPPGCRRSSTEGLRG